tara:strand:- start:9061 stop:9906 length:846 start_codon:yes stop_codon:yes gene_type:complete
MFSIDKILEPYKGIQKVIDSYKEASDVANAVKSAYQSLQLPLEEMKKSLEIIDKRNKIIENSFVPKYFENFQEIGKRIRENLEKTPESLMLLSKYGWYLDFDSELYLPNQLGNLILDGKVEDVDKILMEYYNENLDSILEKLIESYPDRKQIFYQIVAAHREQKYFLTIPCILTQVDGICFDITTKKYFITEKKDKKFRHLPEVATEIAKISGSISEAFSMPILVQTAINSHESKIESFPVKLNRHLIMHGMDKEFGTEKNSLKCLSLLVYLSDMLTLIDE